MLNTIPRAKLHGLPLLAPLANSLTTSAAKVALTCALARAGAAGTALSRFRLGITE
jgi:hypothetical protein